MNARPWKLYAFTGGFFGHIAPIRSFKTREAAERAEAKIHATPGWTTRVWRRADR